MSYKPNENDFMAYLYGEMDEQDKERFTQYLSANIEAQRELQSLRDVRKMLGNVTDKEVIAPPFFVGERSQSQFFNSPHFKIILSIAASLVIVILIGRFSGLRISYFNSELKIGFGKVNEPVPQMPQPAVTSLTSEQVQQMIRTSIQQSNTVMQSSFLESQDKLNTSIQNNLVANSNKIDKLVHAASVASQEQIQGYVASLQNQNMKLVKDYFQLTSTDQKKYIEDLLVDFAKYLQQQRTSDLQVVQTRLNSLEKNTDMFKQETEQILSSIITNTSSTSKGTNN